VLVDADDAFASDDDDVRIHRVEFVDRLRLENMHVDVVKDFKSKRLFLRVGLQLHREGHETRRANLFSRCPHAPNFVGDERVENE